MQITEVFGNMFNRTSKSIVESITNLLQVWHQSPLSKSKLGLFEIAKKQFEVLQQRHHSGEDMHSELSQLEQDIKRHVNSK